MTQETQLSGIVIIDWELYSLSCLLLFMGFPIRIILIASSGMEQKNCKQILTIHRSMTLDSLNESSVNPASVRMGREVCKFKTGLQKVKRQTVQGQTAQEF